MVPGLLGPSRLATRVGSWSRTVVSVVDTAAADLRRIERDLHDGAQARLVALAMDLGLAKEKLLEDPQAAAHMVDEAHGEVKTRTPGTARPRPRHPPRHPHRPRPRPRPVRPRLTLHRPGDRRRRPAPTPRPAIEGIAYFTVSELLQNISKHAHATTRTRRRLAHRGPAAAPGHRQRPGRRARHPPAADSPGWPSGSTPSTESSSVDSPAGGPTTITAELPWRGLTVPRACFRVRPCPAPAPCPTACEPGDALPRPEPPATPDSGMLSASHASYPRTTRAAHRGRRIRRGAGDRAEAVRAARTGTGRSRGGQGAGGHRRGFGAAAGGPDPAADRPRATTSSPAWATATR